MSNQLQIFNMEQGSEQWFHVKRGIPSASEFSKILTNDGKRSKQRDKYLYRLAGESVSGASEETFSSGYTERGKELESEARAYYELIRGVSATEVGFCKLGEVGCSPDALIGEDGGLEIKVPKISTHVFYMHSCKLPSEYFAQVQGSLYVTGREWWDFMSYHPNLKPFIIRVFPDKEWFKHLERELEAFCKDLKFIISEIS